MGYSSNPTARHYVALLVSIILNSASLVLLKAVATQELDFQAAPTVAQLLAIVITPPFILAALAFLGGLYFWIIALKRLDLSLAYPGVSISYGLIAIASWWLFGEVVTLFRWVGIIVIVAGVIVMFLPDTRQTDAMGGGETVNGDGV